MATRLHCAFRNVNNVLYHIYIHDKDYAGAVVEFETDDQGFAIDYQGEDQSPKPQVLTSKCEVNMFIENQNIQDFVDDLNTAYEGRFRMVITTGAAERWVGIVLPDLVEYQDLPFDQKPLFRVTATDGIKRLQSIAYKDTGGPYEGEESIIEHLVKCVAFLGTTDLITTNAWCIVSSTNWKPANIVAGDVMAKTGFDHRALYQIDDRGNYKYSSVYRVIEQLCLRFHCQFKMVNGSYFFTQHNYHEDTNFNIWLYNAAGSLILSGTLDMDNEVSANFSEKLGGGVYSFFPALNAAQVNYIHFGYINLARGYVWYQASQPVIPESPTFYYADDNTAFHFKSTLSYTFSASGDRPKYAKFGVTVQVGTNYLQRTASAGNGAIYNQDQEISGSSAYYEIIVEVNVTQFDSMLTPIGHGIVTLEFTSIAFTTGGQVTFSIDYIESYDAFGVVVSSGLSALWKFSNTEFNPIPGGDITTWSNTRRYTARNAVTGNSESKVVNLIIGEEHGFGRLRIDDGAGGQDGADWGLGASSAGQSIEELLGKEIMRTQASPVRKLAASIEMEMTNIHRTIVHGANRWVFYKGKFVGNYDRLDGEWTLLDTSGATSGDTDEDWVLSDIDTQNGNDVTTVIPVGSGGTPVINSDPSGNPTGPNVNSLLDALFPRTTADISDGATVTQIPVQARGVDGEYKVGQTITLINPFTGTQQAFVITQESQTSDTFLYVQSDTADFFFPEGSWIITSMEQQLSAGGSSVFFREYFPAHASATITVTENGGVLPTNPAAIRIYYDNGQIISKNFWSHSGSDITLTFTPEGDEGIWVEWNT